VRYLLCTAAEPAPLHLEAGNALPLTTETPPQNPYPESHQAGTIVRRLQTLKAFAAQSELAAPQSSGLRLLLSSEYVTLIVQRFCHPLSWKTL
jgi:hypothetical protein